MSSHLELEERLREAAALGDLEEVQTLLDKGVEVNAQNEINGWTCLHWACKRNHTQVVSYLLDSRADKEIFTVNGELAAHLTSKKEIRKLLGVEECDNQEVNDLKLPNAGDSPTNPSFPCVDYQEKDNAPHLLAPPEDNSTAVSYLSESEPSPCLSATQLENTCTPISLHSETELSEDLHEGELPSPISSGVSECTMPRVQSCPVYPSSTSHNRALLTSTVPRQHVPQQANGCCMGTAPPLQPLLLTGTFSYNMQELVLKVRVQNPKENDFIEIELDRQELTYQDLLRVSCHELGINPEQVEKVRKLPNTLIRKDKDVARLQDFQELELVLVKSISSPFRNASATLMERPCYNTKAAKLTY
ncbi:ankyrin repeat domain-containing protein 40-like isoform X1 [Podarcis raffonei]|uniref:ankyrin repeat domain-containing protein 40-like isoform X1 n=1 Tax=Podarcis raffonei TaxID=65483 RepID=UPI002329476D|nr:ankyrin repeat domain-containing protein 40-like isoform X1 [Podarcis raffonei]